MKTWSGSDVDPRGRRLRILWGFIRAALRPWFWKKWRRIWKESRGG